MLFARGNSKIDKSVLCFSLPPVTSCPSSDQCRDSCYCHQAYRQYPTVKRRWDSNMRLAVSNPSLFVKEVLRELKEAKEEVVRIHVSGDFFSQQYVMIWHYIISHSCKKFYGYTKAFSSFYLLKSAALHNMNLIDSYCFDGGINFGPKERVELLRGYGYHICQGVGRKPEVKCGLTCTWCHEKGNAKVAFLQH